MVMQTQSVSRPADRHAVDFVLCILAFLMVGAFPLQAYTDPGNGLLILQIAGAFFLGCIYQARKLLARFRRK